MRLPAVGYYLPKRALGGPEREAEWAAGAVRWCNRRERRPGFVAGRVIAGGSMAVQDVRLHRFTEEQYRSMARIGVLPEEGTELVDGVVVAGARTFHFSSADYWRLGEAGVLDEDERVELIDGKIIELSPIGGRHSACVAHLLKLLVALAGDAEIRIHDVLHLRDGFDPLPDAAVYHPRADRYEASYPTADEAMLVVEVAEWSLLYDRTVKMENYAEAGIPEYWLLDLKRDLVVASRNPVGSQYADVREFRHGEWFSSPALGDARVEVAAILGPARA